MTPSWPQKTQAALAYLFRPLQDIDIYVEDSSDLVLYSELFKRIAPANVKVARVFSPGNRAAVIAKAQSHDFASRRAMFVIDGDFEWVRGEAQPAPGLVYRLDAYCVENLLIHEDAAARILLEETIVSEEDARRSLQFDSWLRRVSAQLLDLFAWFATLNSAKPSEATVGLGVGCVLTSRRSAPQQLDSAKVGNLTANVRTKAESAIGSARANELKDSIKERIDALPRPSDVISGKDFLMPLFECHFHAKMKGRIARRKLRIRLARNCSLQRFDGLSNAMRDSARRRR